jgi:hypothetical protein
MQSDLEVTALVIYDGELIKETKITDKVIILVEGFIKPHHASEIQSRLLCAHYTRHENKFYIPDVLVRELLEGWGYKIIKKSVVYDMDYTGASVGNI